MKTAIKLTTGILAITITVTAVGTLAAAQNTDAIDNARSIAKSLQQKQANDSNAALDAAGVGTDSKPAPGAPAPAVKPAVIPGSQAAAKPGAAAPAAKTASASASTSASGQHIQLQHVSVVPGSDSIQVELSASDSVTPRVSKLSSPARILVELPGTISAVPQNHIAVGNGGVKGVRIGTDGKTPPTTSVVVDLDQAIAYEMTPGAAGKLILTLHTQGGAVAKSTPAPAKASAAASKATAQVQTAAMAGAPAAKLVTGNSSSSSSSSTAKLSSAKASSTTPTTSAPAAKSGAAAKTATAAAQPASKTTQTPVATPDLAALDAVSKIGDTKAAPKAEDKKWAMNGKRDPFFSPVVQQPSGSGCSTGKKCLEIGNINLRGVVKSDSGFIAVVTNSLNKAYFLRENDPVFNGYVVKITGDSVVFQETVEDKLGKPFTREVVKRIFTPAV
jgi:Tfp pilus assembly protein PilP